MATVTTRPSSSTAARSMGVGMYARVRTARPSGSHTQSMCGTAFSHAEARRRAQLAGASNRRWSIALEPGRNAQWQFEANAFAYDPGTPS